MVEDVEELAAEAKLHSFCQMKLALEGEVRLRGSEAAEFVAREVALPRGDGTPCPYLI